MKMECNKCGASVVFVPKTGKCHCNYCGKDMDASQFENEYCEVKYDTCTCSTCGAQLIVDESTMITVCAYCGSRHFNRSVYKDELHINGIIPFSISKEEFITRAEEFMASQRLAPNDFRYETPIAEMKGIYLLVKHYNAKTTAYARGQGSTGEANGSSFFECSYEMKSTHEIENSTSFTNDVFKEIGSYDFKNIRRFSPFYLADFTVDMGEEAEINNEKQICEEEAEYTITDMYERLRTKNIYRQTFGVRIAHTEIESVKNILYPVWLFTIEYKKTKYVYAMNGKTGKIFGGTGKPMKEKDTSKTVASFEKKFYPRLDSIFIIFFVFALFISLINNDNTSWGIMIISPLIYAVVRNWGPALFKLRIRINKSYQRAESKAPVSKTKFNFIIIGIVVFLIWLVWEGIMTGWIFSHFIETIIIISLTVFLTKKLFIEEVSLKKKKDDKEREYFNLQSHFLSSKEEYQGQFGKGELKDLYNNMNLSKEEFKKMTKNSALKIEKEE